MWDLTHKCTNLGTAGHAPPDLLHTLGSGWCKDAWLYITKSIIPKAALPLLDKRIAGMKQFYGNCRGFRLFSDVSSMKGMTSAHYTQLVQLLPVAIGFDGGIIHDRNTRNAVRTLYAVYIWLLIPLLVFVY
jgi:hypothetical protein